MPNSKLLTALTFLALLRPAPAQNVKIASVGLGMTESDLRSALAPSNPVFIAQPSNLPGIRYLVAHSQDETFAFTLIDEKVVALSNVHILPPGQLPFLPPGQPPTIKALRDLLASRTWTPARIDAADTYWVSNASGAPRSDPAACAPAQGPAWLPFGQLSATESSSASALSASGLMKPTLTTYPANCGVTIHLHQTLAPGDPERVASVQIQVADLKAITAYIAQHP